MKIYLLNQWSLLEYLPNHMHSGLKLCRVRDNSQDTSFPKSLTHCSSYLSIFLNSHRRMYDLSHWINAYLQMIFLKEELLGDPIIKQFLKVLCKKLNRSLLFGLLKISWLFCASPRVPNWYCKKNWNKKKKTKTESLYICWGMSRLEPSNIFTYVQIRNICNSAVRYLPSTWPTVFDPQHSM